MFEAVGVEATTKEEEEDDRLTNGTVSLLLGLVVDVPKFWDKNLARE
jgi:hypothetical protein